MTPKEKAKELVGKYKDAPFNCKGCDMPFCDTPCTMLSIYEAKQCALIAVDVSLQFITGDLSETFDKTLYLLEVKQEIIAL